MKILRRANLCGVFTFTLALLLAPEAKAQCNDGGWYDYWTSGYWVFWCPASVPDYSQPYLIHNFTWTNGGDPGQCAYLFDGPQVVKSGRWTETIRIDTDGRPGGCVQQFGIYDPTSQLSGAQLTVDFQGDAGQCWSQGPRVFPTTTDPYSLPVTTPYTIDTDNRAGYCWETFSIAGRPDVSLDIYYVADGNAGQCWPQGAHTVTLGRPVTLYIDADNRGGGCQQSFRLRVNADLDADGRFDSQDNCMTVSNPGQEDCDGDGLGNACDSSNGSYVAVETYPDCAYDQSTGMYYSAVRYEDTSACGGGSYWQREVSRWEFCEFGQCPTWSYDYCPI